MVCSHQHLPDTLDPISYMLFWGFVFLWFFWCVSFFLFNLQCRYDYFFFFWCVFQFFIPSLAISRLILTTSVMSLISVIIFYFYNLHFIIFWLSMLCQNLILFFLKYINYGYFISLCLLFTASGFLWSFFPLFFVGFCFLLFCLLALRSYNFFFFFSGYAGWPAGS